MSRPRVLGAVLAGGRSSRFGSDKAVAMFDGRPLIECVITALNGQVDAVIVCGRRHPGLVSVVDWPTPDLGPLGGLNAALHYAGQHGFELVLTAGCDMPDFRSNILETLIDHEPIVLEGQRLIGLWPANLASKLDDFLAASKDHSIRAWMRAVGANEAPFAGVIANINTSDDLLRLASGQR